MENQSLSCYPHGCSQSVAVTDKGAIDTLLSRLGNLYRATTHAGDQAAQYWADIAVNSKHPLAPLAHVPGVFAALWTPEVAPTTAVTLATAGYGFVALPKNLMHFTTASGRSKRNCTVGDDSFKSLWYERDFRSRRVHGSQRIASQRLYKSSSNDPNTSQYTCGHSPNCSLSCVRTLGSRWCKDCAMRNKTFSRARLLQTATIIFAWICWGIAYWKALWWLIPLSFLPYFLSNRFGHLLDE